MPSDMMEEYALSLVLTSWDTEEEWDQVFTEGNEKTLVWEVFEHWSIHKVEEYASDILGKLRQAYELALEAEGEVNA
jgi:hypothetical protein